MQAEAEEVVEHKIWWITIICYRVLTDLDFKYPGFLYFDYDPLYVCCQDTEKYYNISVCNALGVNVLHVLALKYVYTYGTNQQMHIFKYVQSYIIYLSPTSFDHLLWPSSGRRLPRIHHYTNNCKKCTLYWYICWLQLDWHPVAVVRYTFAHKHYTEQHNECSDTRTNFRWTFCNHVVIHMYYFIFIYSY
jgi:hypothetical protein